MAHDATPGVQPDPPLVASARRLRRAARTMPGPHDDLVVVLPHADWIDFCATLDELPQTEQNRERGNYFGALTRRLHRSDHATVVLLRATAAAREPDAQD